MRYALIPALLAASPALAHPGAHLHPHDGAAWLWAVTGLALIVALALRVRAARAGRRK